MRKIPMWRNDQYCSGFTVLELVATLGLIAIASTLVTNNLKKLDDPVKNSASEIIGFFKQVRARAIATTSAYHLTPNGDSEIITEYAANCASEDRVVDNHFQLNLHDGAHLSDTNWSICINSRGFPDSNTLITVSGVTGNRTVEVFLGGAIREVDYD